MSSKSLAVAGYVSRRPSAKSAYTRPSSSSRETASARISRSVKSLKFRAMRPVYDFWIQFQDCGLDTARQLLPPTQPANFARGPPLRHLAAQRGSQPPQNAPTFHPYPDPQQWNRACSDSSRFTRILRRQRDSVPPLANSRANASSTLASRYIHVDLRDSQQHPQP